MPNPLGYCIECFSKHLGRADEYLGEAVDFYQRDSEMTERVQGKIRSTSDTLGAMEDDLTLEAPPEVRAIYDRAQELRKDLWSSGLDVGQGQISDILSLKNKIGILHNDLYDVKKQLTPVGWLVEAMFPYQTKDKAKDLNPHSTYVPNRESGMVTRKEIIGINGAQLGAKAVERVLVEVDKATGKTLLKPHERYSTWLNIAIGLAAQLIPLYKRMSSPKDLYMVSYGAHHLTKLVDYAEEYAPTAPAVRAAAARRLVYPTGFMVKTNSTRSVETTPMGSAGTGPISRYMV